MEEPSDRALLEELEALAKEHGRVPTKALMVGQGAFSPDTFLERFGSWEVTLTLAGLDPNWLDDAQYMTIDSLDEPQLREVKQLLKSNDPKKFFRGRLLAELHRLAVELDKTPSGSEMANYGNVSPSTYAQYFGSWNAAIEILGLPTNDTLKQCSEDDLIGELRRLAKKKGRRPKTREMAKEGRYSYPTYITRFGSWADACNEASV